MPPSVREIIIVWYTGAFGTISVGTKMRAENLNYFITSFAFLFTFHGIDRVSRNKEKEEPSANAEEHIAADADDNFNRFK